MLLFFDIDGTLFDGKRRLPASVPPALEEAQRRGHRLIVNTGRTLCNLDERLNGLPIDGWILGCGTRILWQGETLQSMEYDPEATLRLREVFLRLAVPVVYECDTGMYFDPAGPTWPAIAHFRAFAAEKGLEREVAEGDPEFRAVKMFCFSEDRRVLLSLEEETARIGMPYTAIDRGNAGWEVVPKGYSKGTGIDRIRKILQVPREECYAFGDSRNDLAMLRHAGVGIAVGSAPEEVKAVCAYVTDLPENDGIAKAMRHYGLIG